MSDKARDVLTLNEMSEYLRMPRSTAYELSQEGKIPGQKVWRHWRFHKAVIDRWCKRIWPRNNLPLWGFHEVIDRSR